MNFYEMDIFYSWQLVIPAITLIIFMWTLPYKGEFPALFVLVAIVVVLTPAYFFIWKPYGPDILSLPDAQKIPFFYIFYLIAALPLFMIAISVVAKLLGWVLVAAPLLALLIDIALFALFIKLFPLPDINTIWSWSRQIWYIIVGAAFIIGGAVGTMFVDTASWGSMDDGAQFAMSCIPLSGFIHCLAEDYDLFTEDSLKARHYLFHLGILGLIGWGLVLYFPFLLAVQHASGIPVSAYILAIVSAALCSWLFNLFVNSYGKGARKSGDVVDRSHEWRIGGSQKRWRPATQQEVYDHYHGHGSWYGELRSEIGIRRLLAFGASVGIPMIFLGQANFLNSNEMAFILLVMSIVSFPITVAMAKRYS